MFFNRVLIVYTPKVGNKKIKKRIPKINKLMKKISANEPIFYETKSVNDTHSFISENLLKKEFDVILSAGGDGLVSSVCNALMLVPKEFRVPFLPLPMGSGNTFAADLNIKSIKGAVESIKKSSCSSKIDLLKVTANGKTFYCVNVLGAGFITDAANLAEQSGKKLGAFSYILGVLKALKNMCCYKVRLFDRKGEIIFQTSKAVLISFNNNPKTGAAFNMAPDALIDDGLADVIVLHDISRRELFSGFLKIFNGEHIFCRGCEYFQTDYVRVESEPKLALMPDGELFGTSPFELETVKDELEVALELG